LGLCGWVSVPTFRHKLVPSSLRVKGSTWHTVLNPQPNRCGKLRSRACATPWLQLDSVNLRKLSHLLLLLLLLLSQPPVSVSIRAALRFRISKHCTCTLPCVGRGPEVYQPLSRKPADVRRSCEPARRMWQCCLETTALGSAFC
jgi:hypothetical protein